MKTPETTITLLDNPRQSFPSESEIERTQPQANSERSDVHATKSKHKIEIEFADDAIIGNIKISGTRTYKRKRIPVADLKRRPTCPPIHDYNVKPLREMRPNHFPSVCCENYE